MNEKFANFVLNAAPLIRYGCSPVLGASYYSIDAINVCNLMGRLSALTLLHEARHKTAGWHNTHCPPNPNKKQNPGEDLNNFIYECDQGMDLVYGWEIALEWGLLQGASQTQASFPLGGLATNSLVGEIVNSLSHIRTFSEPLTSIGNQTTLANYVQNFAEIEDLVFPSPVNAVRFEKQPETILSQYPVGAQAGDFDGDGRRDLVFVFPNEVQVFLNQGSGKFIPTIGFPLTTHCIDHKLLIIADDFDQDGLQDIVFSCPTATSGINANLNILFGEGHGYFSKQITLATYAKGLPFAVGDLNQDGIPDIVTAFRDLAEIQIFLSKKKPYVVNLKTQFMEKISKFVALRDFNADQKTDLLYISDDSIQVFFGKGDTTFVSQVSTPSSQGDADWLIDDFNGDGNIDLLPNYAGSFCVTPFLGTGNGTFVNIEIDVCEWTLATLINPLNPYLSFKDHIQVDLNGDGKIDLVSLDINGVAEIALSRGSLSYRSLQIPEVFEHNTEFSRNFIVTADFSGDGAPDLVFVTAETNPNDPGANRFVLFINQGP